MCVAQDVQLTCINVHISLHSLRTPEEEEMRDAREGVVYEEACSYLWVELELHRPLVPKRPVSVLAER